MFYANLQYYHDPTLDVLKQLAKKTVSGDIHLWVTVTILQMGHQAEPLPSHTVAPSPQARDVVPAKWAMFRNRMVLNFLWSFEGFHATCPFAEERFRCVNLDGRLAGRRGW